MRAQSRCALLVVLVPLLSSCHSTFDDQAGFGKTSEGKGIHVYIVDSYVDSMHPNLRDVSSSTVYFIEDTPPPEVDNVRPLSHGTTIALAIVAGSKGLRNNKLLLHSLVVADESLADPLAAKDALLSLSEIHHNIVVNLSLGSLGPPPQLFVESLNTLVDQDNVIVVIAAGNQASNLDTRESLCGAKGSNILCVGALYDQSSLTDASNFGQVVDLASKGLLHVSEVIYMDGSISNVQGSTSIEFHLSGSFREHERLRECYLFIRKEKLDTSAMVRQEDEILWEGGISGGQNVFENLTFTSTVDTLTIHVSGSLSLYDLGDLVCYGVEAPSVELGGTTSIAAGYVSGVAARHWIGSPHLSSAEVVHDLCEIARQNPIDGVRCGAI